MKDDDVRIACDKFCGKCEECDPLRFALKLRHDLDRGLAEYLNLHLKWAREEVRWARSVRLDDEKYRRALASLVVEDPDALGALVDRAEAAGLERLMPGADAPQMRAHLVKVMGVEL